MKNIVKLFIFCTPLSIIGLEACKSDAQTEKLPIIGQKTIAANGDTIYPTIPTFSFINQNGETVTNQQFDGKIYVADFFFSHCPTICPKVTAQMKRVHDAFLSNPNVLFLSHSIDPERDTVGRLRVYAEGLGVKAPKWHFVTGAEDSLLHIAESYYSIARRDSLADGGFNHSGNLILIDNKKRVRAFCNGLDTAEVSQFIQKVGILLNEK